MRQLILRVSRVLLVVIAENGVEVVFVAVHENAQKYKRWLVCMRLQDDLLAPGPDLLPTLVHASKAPRHVLRLAPTDG